MAPTKSFKDLVRSRVARDPDFAAALLREGIDTTLTNDNDTGKVSQRDPTRGTILTSSPGPLARAASAYPTDLIF